MLHGVACVPHSTPQSPAPNTAEASAELAVATARSGSDEEGYAHALAKAHAELAGVADGRNADYIPVLAQVDNKLFGIALVTVAGDIYEIGDSKHEFSIQSISKVFTLARAIDGLGAATVAARVGVNATGLPFNSIMAIELNKPTHPAMNPLVNAGAISTVALLPDTPADAKWRGLVGTYSAFAGRLLEVNAEVYKSESETNTRNRAIATLLQAYDVIRSDPAEALDLYTRQCSVSVSARDLALMGATLANRGLNPVTAQQVVKPEVVPHVLAVMATAGLYETTGTWMYEVGVPAKSGVGGGLVAVVPGRFAIATFSPPLDEAGNSVRGQRAIAAIVAQLGGRVFEPPLVSSAAPAGSSSALSHTTDGGVQ